MPLVYDNAIIEIRYAAIAAISSTGGLVEVRDCGFSTTSGSTTMAYVASADYTRAAGTNWTVTCTSATCGEWFNSAWDDDTAYALSAAGALPSEHKPRRSYNARPSDAEVQARLREQRENEERVMRQVAERDAASARAEAALFARLSPEQRDDLKNKNCFFVEAFVLGQRRRYRIHRGFAGNIKRIDTKGNVVESLCIHPRMQVPVADVMLAQKLWIEANEPEFRRVANITVVR